MRSAPGARLPGMIVDGGEDRRPIAVLSPTVAQRIAAGEVIDRPAAVVKELVENALDAGAQTVEVAIRGAGLESITVSDDGHGIPEEQLPLAFARHGTSKLRDSADLEHLQTLGFRGEALPSIAAVASVELTSATDAGMAGARLVVREGEILEHGLLARMVGTTVRVRELFATQPVRRGFLPSARAESAQFLALLRRYALAWPAVRFVLTLEGRTALRTAGIGEASALAAVFGPSSGRMRAFGPVAAARARFTGYLGDPGLNRGDREGIVVIVNRRWVAPARWLSALESAYRPLLKPGRHPVLVLWGSVPPDQLDVNLHPAKLEVRMAGEDEVLAALAEAVREHLGQTPPAAALLGPLEGRPRQARLPRVLGEGQVPYGETGQPDVGRLRVVGQVHDRMIAAQDGDALYLIDQHRAEERAIYEALVDDAGGRPSQELLQPVHIELRQQSPDALEAALPELARLGFRCERFGRRAFLVRAVPVGLPEGGGEAVAAAVGEEVGEGRDWRDRLLISVACRTALRRGQPLTLEEMEVLLGRLARCAAPAICPHGSPIIARVGATELARHFEWR